MPLIFRLSCVLILALGCEQRYADGVRQDCGACPLPRVCASGECVLGQGFVELGADGIAGGSSPSVAVAPDGVPYVAYTTESGEIEVARFDGSAWSTLPAVDATETPSSGPRLAVGPDGSLVIAWVERRYLGTDGTYPDAGEIYLRRFDGAAWADLAGSGSGGGISGAGGPLARDARVAVGPSGEIVVAWLEQMVGWDVYARAFRDGAWQSIDGSGSEEGVSRAGETAWAPDLAIDRDGRALLAWYELRGAYAEVFLRRNGQGAWSGIAGSDEGGGVSDSPEANSHSPVIAVDAAGTPWVAWRDDAGGASAIHARRPDADRWAGIADDGRDDIVARTGAHAEAPSIAAGAGGVVIAWGERHAGGEDVRVFHLDGDTFQALGDTASAGGLSRSGTGCDPSVAIGRDGRVVVAWEDGGAIEVRRYE